MLNQCQRPHYWKWLKATALATVMIFTSTSVLWADSGNFMAMLRARNNHVEPNVQVNPAGSHPFQSIRLPESLGEIESKHLGSKGLVVHVQDAHANEEAQMNIARILDYLVKDHGLEMVHIEGAEGKLETELLSFFPNKNVRREVAQYFLKNGRMGGAEYLNLVHRPELVLYGVEEDSLYEENRQAYLGALKSSERDAKILSSLHKVFKDAVRFVYSKDLRELYRHKQGFIESPSSLVAYAKYLVELAERLGQETAQDYARIHALLSLMTLEKEIQFEQAKDQVQDFVSSLKQIMGPGRQEALLKRSLQFKNQEISRAAYYRYLQAQLRGLPASSKIHEQYANVIRYFEYILLFDSVGVEVFEEVQTLESNLKELLFENEEQRQLDHALRLYEVYQKIFDFSLTKRDAQFFFNNRDDFSAAHLRSTLKPVFDRYRFSYQLPENLEMLDQDLVVVESFYQVAIERDRVLVENTVKNMGEEPSSMVALVTGGFHTPGIERQLREKGYSYLTIRPSIQEKMDRVRENELYQAALGESILDLQKNLAGSYFVPKSDKLNDPRFQLMARPVTVSNLIAQLERDGIESNAELYYVLSVALSTLSKDPVLAIQSMIKALPENLAAADRQKLQSGFNAIKQGVSGEGISYYHWLPNSNQIRFYALIPSADSAEEKLPTTFQLYQSLKDAIVRDLGKTKLLIVDLDLAQVKDSTIKSKLAALKSGQIVPIPEPAKVVDPVVEAPVVETKKPLQDVVDQVLESADVATSLDDLQIKTTPASLNQTQPAVDPVVAPRSEIRNILDRIGKIIRSINPVNFLPHLASAAVFAFAILAVSLISPSVIAQEGGNANTNNVVGLGPLNTQMTQSSSLAQSVGNPNDILMPANQELPNQRGLAGADPNYTPPGAFMDARRIGYRSPEYYYGKRIEELHSIATGRLITAFLTEHNLHINSYDAESGRYDLFINFPDAHEKVRFPHPHHDHLHPSRWVWLDRDQYTESPRTKQHRQFYRQGEYLVHFDSEAQEIWRIRLTKRSNGLYYLPKRGKTQADIGLEIIPVQNSLQGKKALSDQIRIFQNGNVILVPREDKIVLYDFQNVTNQDYSKVIVKTVDGKVADVISRNGVAVEYVLDTGDRIILNKLIADQLGYSAPELEVVPALTDVRFQSFISASGLTSQETNDRSSQALDQALRNLFHPKNVAQDHTPLTQAVIENLKRKNPRISERFIERTLDHARRSFEVFDMYRFGNRYASPGYKISSELNDTEEAIFQKMVVATRQALLTGEYSYFLSMGMRRGSLDALEILLQEPEQESPFLSREQRLEIKGPVVLDRHVDRMISIFKKTGITGLTRDQVSYYLETFGMRTGIFAGTDEIQRKRIESVMERLKHLDKGGNINQTWVNRFLNIVHEAEKLGQKYPEPSQYESDLAYRQALLNFEDQFYRFRVETQKTIDSFMNQFRFSDREQITLKPLLVSDMRQILFGHVYAPRFLSHLDQATSLFLNMMKQDRLIFGNNDFAPLFAHEGNPIIQNILRKSYQRFARENNYSILRYEEFYGFAAYVSTEYIRRIELRGANSRTSHSIRGVDTFPGIMQAVYHVLGSRQRFSRTGDPLFETGARQQYYAQPLNRYDQQQRDISGALLNLEQARGYKVAPNAELFHKFVENHSELYLNALRDARVVVDRYLYSTWVPHGDGTSRLARLREKLVDSLVFMQWSIAVLDDEALTLSQRFERASYVVDNLHRLVSLDSDDMVHELLQDHFTPKEVYLVDRVFRSEMDRFSAGSFNRRLSIRPNEARNFLSLRQLNNDGYLNTTNKIVDEVEAVLNDPDSLRPLYYRRTMGELIRYYRILSPNTSREDKQKYKRQLGLYRGLGDLLETYGDLKTPDIRAEFYRKVEELKARGVFTDANLMTDQEVVEWLNKTRYEDEIARTQLARNDDRRNGDSWEEINKNHPLYHPLVRLRQEILLETFAYQVSTELTVRMNIYVMMVANDIPMTEAESFVSAIVDLSDDYVFFRFGDHSFDPSSAKQMGALFAVTHDIYKKVKQRGAAYANDLDANDPRRAEKIAENERNLWTALINAKLNQLEVLTANNPETDERMVSQAEKDFQVVFRALIEDPNLELDYNDPRIGPDMEALTFGLLSESMKRGISPKKIAEVIENFPGGMKALIALMGDLNWEYEVFTGIGQFGRQTVDSQRNFLDLKPDVQGDIISFLIAAGEKGVATEYESTRKLLAFLREKNALPDAEKKAWRTRALKSAYDYYRVWFDEDATEDLNAEQLRRWVFESRLGNSIFKGWLAAEAEKGIKKSQQPRNNAKPRTADVEETPRSEVRSLSRRRALQGMLLGGVGLGSAASASAQESSPGTAPAAPANLVQPMVAAVIPGMSLGAPEGRRFQQIQDRIEINLPEVRPLLLNVESNQDQFWSDSVTPVLKNRELKKKIIQDTQLIADFRYGRGVIDIEDGIKRFDSRAIGLVTNRVRALVYLHGGRTQFDLDVNNLPAKQMIDLFKALEADSDFGPQYFETVAKLFYLNQGQSAEEATRQAAVVRSQGLSFFRQPQNSQAWNFLDGLTFSKMIFLPELPDNAEDRKEYIKNLALSVENLFKILTSASTREQLNTYYQNIGLGDKQLDPQVTGNRERQQVWGEYAARAQMVEVILGRKDFSAAELEQTLTELNAIYNAAKEEWRELRDAEIGYFHRLFYGTDVQIKNNAYSEKAKQTIRPYSEINRLTINEFFKLVSFANNTRDYAAHGNADVEETRDDVFNMSDGIQNLMYDFSEGRRADEKPFWLTRYDAARVLDFILGRPNQSEPGLSNEKMTPGEAVQMVTQHLDRLDRIEQTNFTRIRQDLLRDVRLEMFLQAVYMLHHRDENGNVQRLGLADISSWTTLIKKGMFSAEDVAGFLKDDGRFEVLEKRLVSRIERKLGKEAAENVPLFDEASGDRLGFIVRMHEKNKKALKDISDPRKREIYNEKWLETWFDDVYLVQVAAYQNLNRPDDLDKIFVDSTQLPYTIETRREGGDRIVEVDQNGEPRTKNLRYTRLQNFFKTVARTDVNYQNLGPEGNTKRRFIFAWFNIIGDLPTEEQIAKGLQDWENLVRRDHVRNLTRNNQHRVQREFLARQHMLTTTIYDQLAEQVYRVGSDQTLKSSMEGLIDSLKVELSSALANLINILPNRYKRQEEIRLAKERETTIMYPIRDQAFIDRQQRKQDYVDNGFDTNQMRQTLDELQKKYAQDHAAEGVVALTAANKDSTIGSWVDEMRASGYSLDEAYIRFVVIEGQVQALYKDIHRGTEKSTDPAFISSLAQRLFVDWGFAGDRMYTLTGNRIAEVDSREITAARARTLGETYIEESLANELKRLQAVLLMASEIEKAFKDNNVEGIRVDEDLAYEWANNSYNSGLDIEEIKQWVQKAKQFQRIVRSTSVNGTSLEISDLDALLRVDEWLKIGLSPVLAKEKVVQQNIAQVVGKETQRISSNPLTRRNLKLLNRSQAAKDRLQKVTGRTEFADWQDVKALIEAQMVSRNVTGAHYKSLVDQVIERQEFIEQRRAHYKQLSRESADMFSNKDLSPMAAYDLAAETSPLEFLILQDKKAHPSVNLSLADVFGYDTDTLDEKVATPLNASYRFAALDLLRKLVPKEIRDRDKGQIDLYREKLEAQGIGTLKIVTLLAVGATALLGFRDGTYGKYKESRRRNPEVHNRPAAFPGTNLARNLFHVTTPTHYFLFKIAATFFGAWAIFFIIASWGFTFYSVLAMVVVFFQTWVLVMPIDRFNFTLPIAYLIGVITGGNKIKESPKAITADNKVADGHAMMIANLSPYRYNNDGDLDGVKIVLTNAAKRLRQNDDPNVFDVYFLQIPPHIKAKKDGYTAEELTEAQDNIKKRFEDAKQMWIDIVKENVEPEMQQSVLNRMTFLVRYSGKPKPELLNHAGGFRWLYEEGPDTIDPFASNANDLVMNTPYLQADPSSNVDGYMNLSSEPFAPELDEYHPPLVHVWRAVDETSFGGDKVDYSQLRGDQYIDMLEVRRQTLENRRKHMDPIVERAQELNAQMKQVYDTVNERLARKRPKKDSFGYLNWNERKAFNQILKRDPELAQRHREIQEALDEVHLDAITLFAKMRSGIVQISPVRNMQVADAGMDISYEAMRSAAGVMATVKTVGMQPPIRYAQAEVHKNLYTQTMQHHPQAVMGWSQRAMYYIFKHSASSKPMFIAYSIAIPLMLFWAAGFWGLPIAAVLDGALWRWYSKNAPEPGVEVPGSIRTYGKQVFNMDFYNILFVRPWLDNASNLLRKIYTFENNKGAILSEDEMHQEQALLMGIKLSDEEKSAVIRRLENDNTLTAEERDYLINDYLSNNYVFHPGTPIGNIAIEEDPQYNQLSNKTRNKTKWIFFDEIKQQREQFQDIASQPIIEAFKSGIIVGTFLGIASAAILYLTGLITTGPLTLGVVHIVALALTIGVHSMLNLAIAAKMREGMIEGKNFYPPIAPGAEFFSHLVHEGNSSVTVWGLMLFTTIYAMVVAAGITVAYPLIGEWAFAGTMLLLLYPKILNSFIVAFTEKKNLAETLEFALTGFREGGASSLFLSNLVEQPIFYLNTKFRVYVSNLYGIGLIQPGSFVDKILTVIFKFMYGAKNPADLSVFNVAGISEKNPYFTDVLFESRLSYAIGLSALSIVLFPIVGVKVMMGVLAFSISWLSVLAISKFWTAWKSGKTIPRSIIFESVIAIGLLVGTSLGIQSLAVTFTSDLLARTSTIYVAMLAAAGISFLLGINLQKSTLANGEEIGLVEGTWLTRTLGLALTGVVMALISVMQFLPVVREWTKENVLPFIFQMQAGDYHAPVPMPALGFESILEMSWPWVLFFNFMIASIFVYGVSGFASGIWDALKRVFTAKEGRLKLGLFTVIGASITLTVALIFWHASSSEDSIETDKAPDRVGQLDPVIEEPVIYLNDQFVFRGSTDEGVLTSSSINLDDGSFQQIKILDLSGNLLYSIKGNGYIRITGATKKAGTSFVVGGRHWVNGVYYDNMRIVSGSIEEQDGETYFVGKLENVHFEGNIRIKIGDISEGLAVETEITAKEDLALDPTRTSIEGGVSIASFSSFNNTASGIFDASSIVVRDRDQNEVVRKPLNERPGNLIFPEGPYSLSQGSSVFFISENNERRPNRPHVGVESIQVTGDHNFGIQAFNDPNAVAQDPDADNAYGNISDQRTNFKKGETIRVNYKLIAYPPDTRTLGVAPRSDREDPKAAVNVPLRSELVSGMAATPVMGAGALNSGDAMGIVSPMILAIESANSIRFQQQLNALSNISVESFDLEFRNKVFAELNLDQPAAADAGDTGLLVVQYNEKLGYNFERIEALVKSAENLEGVEIALYIDKTQYPDAHDNFYDNETLKNARRSGLLKLRLIDSNEKMVGSIKHIAESMKLDTKAMWQIVAEQLGEESLTALLKATPLSQGTVLVIGSEQDIAPDGRRFQLQKILDAIITAARSEVRIAQSA